ncbi:PAS domain S-box protein, partial [Candidatus Bipolaricaulota bacterium]|nr:PAS domain S-box protein [Candidatus Bipolaricaulota bacterium]
DRQLAEQALHLGAQDYLPKLGLAPPMLRRSMFYAIERHRVQQALRISERQFRAIFQASPLAISIALPEGRAMVTANRAFYDMLGYDDDDLPDLTLAAITHPDDIQADLKDIAAISEGRRKTFTREKRLVRRDGKTVWVKAASTLLKDVAGIPEQILTVQQNITAEKEAAQALELEQRHLHSVMETMPAFLYLQATDHTIPFSNSKFRETFGDPKGRTCHQIFHGCDSPCSACATLNVLETRQESIREWTDASGRVFELRERPYASTAGEEFALVIGVEITDLIEATAALRISEQRFRELAEMLPEVVFECELDGRLTFVNQVAFRQFGYSREQFENGLNAFTMLADEDVGRIRASVERLLAGGEEHSTRYTARRSDGSTFPVIIHSSVIHQDGRPVGLRGIVVDITEQIDAQQALSESESRLRAILDTVPDLLFQLDEEDRILLYHAPADELYVPPETFLGKRFQDILPEEPGTRLGDALAALKQTGAMKQLEYTLPIQGKLKDFEARILQSGAAQTLVIVRDISERKQAQNALEMADSIVRSSPVGMFIYRYEDPDRLILANANPEAEKLIGIRLAEWLGREFSEIWPQTMSSGIKRAFLEAFKSGTLYSTDNFVSEGGPVEGHYRIRAFRIPEDRLVVSFEDISDQIEAQRHVQESEERYRNIVEMSPIGILTINLKGIVTSSNPAFLHMIGYQDEELVGRRFTRIPAIRPRDLSKYVRTFRSIARGQSPEPFATSWIAKDGSEHYGEIQATVMRRADGKRGIQAIVQDVTERRLAEDRQREYERLLSESQRIAKLGGWEYQISTGVNRWTSGLYDIFGVDETFDVSGLDAVVGFFRPEDGQRIRDAFERAVRTGEGYNLELRFTNARGDELWTRATAEAEKEGGRVARLHGNFQDITERKRMEESLQLTQFSMDSASAIILWLHEDGEIVFVNETACKALGYSRSQLLGKYAWDIQTDYPTTRRAELWKRLMDGEEPSEATFLRSDGTPLPVEITAQHLRFRGREYEFVLAVDITERKEARAALEQSEENYRTIFDSASDAIMIHDPMTGRLLDGNEKIEEMFGYPVEEFLNLQVSEFSSGEPPYTQEEALQFIHAAAQGTPQIFEWYAKKRSGELFWVEVSLRQVALLGKSVVLAVVRDVSERKQFEAQLRQGQKLESIGTLASGVAHEINNPLMGMINYAELISSRSDDESLREFAEGIKEEGDRVAKIVRNLLSFSRQDREEHSQARMKDIVDASLTLIGSLLRKDFIQLELDVPEDLPAIRCRSQQIQQVLINLVTNARDSLNAKFLDSGDGKKLQISSRLMSHDTSTWLRTTVEDCGLGIPDDVATRIFDPFFTTKARNEGTGLGLSISYGIVREHGGRLTVESKPDCYTRFHIDLPVQEEDG